MVDEERAVPPNLEARDDVDAVSSAWVLAVLLRRHRIVVGITGFGLLLSTVIALFLAPEYTSTFSFIPQSGQDQSRSGLANLAGQFGISVVGTTQPPQLFAALLSTRDILATVARDSFALAPGDRKRVPLSQFLHIRHSDARVTEEKTIEALRKRVVAANAATRTTGVVAVTVTTESPSVSYAIARRLLDELNRYNFESRKSQAGQERRFTEGRLADATAALRAAEDAMQSFLFSNRQFGSSPQLAFQRDRLQREVNLRQQIVMGLTQQYEDARIREVRDTPVITMIEMPVLPATANPRYRIVIVILGSFIAGLVGVALVVIQEAWTRQRRAEPGEDGYAQLASEWRRLRLRYWNR